jgi:deazaflavin-dependent oxidoreductase (nitroreductase family)
MSDAPVPSALDWVADHAQRYVASDGADGHEWKGVPCLVLDTLGRRSGQWRRQVLIYGRDGDGPDAPYVVVASKGGAPEHPLWYRNLTEHPRVHVQVGAERFEADAETVGPEDRARLWPVMTARWPAYDEYQGRTERTIPLVRLRRVG